MTLKIVTSSDFETDPIDEGVYETIVTKLEERKRFNRFDNTDEIGISVEFTIVSEGVMKDKQAYRFFTPYITANSKLKVLCVAILGREFEAEELASINSTATLAKFIGGRPVQIIVKQRISQKGTKYYNVSDFVKSANLGAVAKDPIEVIELTSEVIDPVIQQQEAVRRAKQAQENQEGQPTTGEQPPHPVEAPPVVSTQAPLPEAGNVTPVAVTTAPVATTPVPTLVEPVAPVEPVVTPKEVATAEKLADEVDEGIQKQEAEKATKGVGKPASDEDIEAIFGAKKATPKKA